jgi:prepilin-type N-terminal cleavage/methylation domain-containing protein/prepilin-type processing-associated H-X9-DG protein
MSPANARARAFTVVELLVVIAIIGVLMSLILPTVHGVQGKARQKQCANHMKQLGFAELSYEASHQFYSASRSWPVNLNITRPANIDTSASATNPNAQSWVMPLLPHIEQVPLYTQIESASGSLPNFDDQRIPIMHCPSDISEFNSPNRSSYAVNGGRFNGTPNGTWPLDWQASGCFDDRLKGSSDTFQIFEGPRAMSVAELTRGDGGSNTLMLLENVDVMGWNRADNERDVAVVWGPTIPTNNLNMGRRKTGEPFTNANARPSSFHTNGFNVVFCDASVRFIAESIDYDVYCQLMTSNSANLKDPSTNTPTAVTLPALTASSY